MSKKQFRSAASSGRAASSALSSPFGFNGYRPNSGALSSSLSYVFEPPDLSRISYPQLAVSFKNLLKKDGVTKAKALEDISDFLESPRIREPGVDDGLLEAWVSLYPRISVDTSRRVRQLAHSVQGSFCLHYGKKMAKYMPKVVGAWIAGQNDNDRVVARAAHDSLYQAFTTEQKRMTLWKAYRTSILDFVDDAALQQTAQTLSDERTVSPDEAMAKHVRVAASAVLTLRELIEEPIDNVSGDDQTTMEHILQDKKLWAYAAHLDPSLRRAVYALLRACLERGSLTIDLQVVSSALVSKALYISQLGSSFDFSETLALLTEQYPILWTDKFAGKAPAGKQLCRFLKRGSQSGPPQYWTNLLRILKNVPPAVLSSGFGVDGSDTHESFEGLLTSFLDGVTNKEEPKSNISTAWSVYIDLVAWVSNRSQDAGQVDHLVDNYLCPILSHYLRPSATTLRWALNGSHPLKICLKCFCEVIGLGAHRVQKLWIDLSHDLIDEMEMSLPAQSQGFGESQDAVAASARRWFSFEEAALTSNSSDVVKQAFEKTTADVIEAALYLLASRKGKPYGAAAAIESAFHHVPGLSKESKSLMDKIMDFFTKSAPDLVDSPSASPLVSTLLRCKDKEGYADGLETLVDAFVNSAQTSSGWLKILSAVDLAQLRSFPSIQKLVTDSVDQALRSDSPVESEWDAAGAFLSNPFLSFSDTEDLIDTVANALVSGDNLQGALVGLDHLGRTAPAKLSTYALTSPGSKYLARLILLRESSDDTIARQASALEARIKDLLTKQGGSELAGKSVVEIIRHNLEAIDDDTLPIDVVLDQTRLAIAETDSESNLAIITEVFPTEKVWRNSLQPFLDVPPNGAFAMTDPLGGALNTIVDDSQASVLCNIAFDSHGFSLPLRITLFVLDLASDSNAVHELRVEQRRALFLYLPLAIQLVDDNLALAGANHMWNVYVDEVEHDMFELVSQGRRTMAMWMMGSPTSNGLESIDSEFLAIWENQLDNISGSSPFALHLGRSYARILRESADATGSCRYSNSWREWTRKVRSSDLLYTSTFLSAFKTLLVMAPDGRRLVNELISDLTGIDVRNKCEAALHVLVSFNIIAQGEEAILEDIPKQRMVFLIKHLVQWIESEDMRVCLRTEVIKSFNIVLPYIKDVYGSHWQSILDALGPLKEDLSSDRMLEWDHASLRAVGVFRSLTEREEANDDLNESWDAWSADVLPKFLLNMLQSFNDRDYQVHQPLNIVTDLLARQTVLAKMKCDEQGIHDTFGLLRVENSGVQKASSVLISRYLPSAQEELSVQVGASGAPVGLPDELLSLLVETPNLGVLARGRSHERMWLNTRGFLLSWRALFEHFAYASHRVQMDYVDSVKEGGYLPHLLEFIFDLLGHSNARPIDASKFPITTYAIDSEETSEKDVQALAIHIYYLCLVHLPVITKVWWIDSRKRIKGQIETWTQKYISSHVIASAFEAVSKWSSEDTTDDDQYNLEIRISPKASELTASIAIDELGDTPPISLAISLPLAYPLQPAVVTSRHRVVVDEKKWRSWLLTIQGVIMFHGNLADGLLAFRKNVQGALKGHSECAICYSIISSDMQTPKKRCGTCKNTFHNSCLFRWFKSSNSNTCPLCRNSFSFG